MDEIDAQIQENDDHENLTIKVQSLPIPPRFSPILEEVLPALISLEYNIINVLKKEKVMSSCSKRLSLAYDVDVSITGGRKKDHVENNFIKVAIAFDICSYQKNITI